MRCKFTWYNGQMRCDKEAMNNLEYCARHLIATKNHTFSIKTVFVPSGFDRTHYKDYIQSDKWIERAKNERLKNPQCSLCNRKGELHVHHRTYVRLGQEIEGDLVVLCKDCHNMFHKQYEYDRSVGTFFLRKFVRKSKG